MHYFKEGKIRSSSEIRVWERHQIIKEYLSGDLTKVEIWRKYTGQTNEHGSLLRWMRMYGYIDDEKPRPKICTTSTMESSESPIENENLKLKIKELEKQLEEARLKEEGYRLMIDQAESTFKIKIRKKSNTK